MIAKLGRTAAIVVSVLVGVLVVALYGLLFLMSRGDFAVTLGSGAGAIEIRFANLALAILVVLPVLAVAAWVLRLPQKVVAGFERNASVKGYGLLEEALIAAASGDTPGARAFVARAERQMGASPVANIVSARAAEEAGDIHAAERAYAALIADARTEVVGRRGLAEGALSRRDFDTASLHAAAAFARAPSARWAFTLLFEAEVRGHRWRAAMETLKQGGKRGHVPADVARRRRAVLLTAEAARIELSEPDAARALIEEAVKLSPSFAPGAALAARLLQAAGKGWRASGVLEDAWTASPHPALAHAYRDLKSGEEPAARAKRMAGLAAMNPTHRESRILRAELALAAGDAAGAQAELAPMTTGPAPSARICGLAAQVARDTGNIAAAADWIARAATAADEPDWSDLDPEGPAFAYGPADWARLVFSFGDAGQLIHPRHERYAPRAGEVPALALPAPSSAPAPAPTPPAPAPTLTAQAPANGAAEPPSQAPAAEPAPASLPAPLGGAPQERG